MIVEFSVVDTKDFTIEHLFDSPENQDLIANFQATNDAAGLEDYLKIQSMEDEENNCSRTYLVKDALSGELVAYFSLRTGLITIQVQDDSWGSIHSRSLFYRLCKGCRSMSALAPCISTPCQKKS